MRYSPSIIKDDLLSLAHDLSEGPGSLWLIYTSQGLYIKSMLSLQPSGPVAPREYRPLSLYYSGTSDSWMIVFVCDPLDRSDRIEGTAADNVFQQQDLSNLQISGQIAPRKRPARVQS